MNSSHSLLFHEEQFDNLKKINGGLESANRVVIQSPNNDPVNTQSNFFICQWGQSCSLLRTEYK